MPDTFLSKTLNSDPRDRIVVEIGDSKQLDFKPQIKLMRWDNEVNLSIRGEEKIGSTSDLLETTSKYITPDYEIHMYEIAETGTEKGYEFEWVLKVRPPSNVLTATLLSKGLNFFYQPKLTDEYVAGFSDEFKREISSVTETEVRDSTGNILVFRPEHAIGSYAVYHKSKGALNDSSAMDYKCGKAFHIYRPKAIDSKGNEIWADLNVNEGLGILTVTVDSKWLDTASYPVKVDPTFGRTSLGVSGYSGNDTIVGYTGTPASSGTTSSITTGIQTRGAGEFKSALYKVSDGSLLSPQSAQSSTPGTGWITNNVSITIDAINYYIVAWGGLDGTLLIAGDSGAGGGKFAGAAYGGAWPGTYSPSSSGNSRSIYATYSSGGPARRRVGMGFRR